jgi:alkylation response protein AidB-like acyl-CoA dehydrogenase
MPVDRETLAAFTHLARTFAQKEVRSMVGQETRDGDLSLLPALLEKAGEAGLMASPSPDHPGHQYGVWGRACLAEGSTASIAILEEMAKECAGVAFCFHAAGLGALALAEPLFRRPAWVFFPRGERLSWGFLEGKSPLQQGSFSVFAPPGWDGLVAFYPSSQGWRLHAVARDEVQVKVLAPRTGLMAAEIFQVELPLNGSKEAKEDPRALLRLHLLGLTAIAVGNALGAVNAASGYAAQRYQGGTNIGNHAAVKRLLGRAKACAEAVRGQLHQVAQEEGENALVSAMVLAVRGLEECWMSTSDALQVLGGYGYMEDYRLEKRLRDAMALRCIPPSLRDLLLMLGEIE